MSLVNSDLVRGLRVGILAAGPSSGAVGGAERLYQGMLSGFQALGCRAELVQIVADEPDYDVIVENYHNVEKLDLSHFDVVVSTKAPTFAVRHPCHVVYLVHTVRVFDDMFSEVFPAPGEKHFRQRAVIHAMDFQAMTAAKARFAIGHEVANRLYRWRGLDAEVIHPPLGFNAFRSAPSEGYFFLPGRLHNWKRVDLVIEAVRRSTKPLLLIIAGTGEAEASLRAKSAGDERIVFVGRIDDETLVDYYARALAVPFVPLREDFGYVTLEAFASAKPVITCTDSGEPTRLVVHRENGLICQPHADSLRETMEWIAEHSEAAKEMGVHGARLVADSSWEGVALRLLDAVMSMERKAESTAPAEVAVLDMQPIDPPIGGGRLRLFGLYHGLGGRMRCTYVGTYDWPGEKYRRHALSSGLEEITVPLSDAHHAAAQELSMKAGGKTVIDIAFARQGYLSEKYLATVRSTMRTAQVVVFSHPWVYPLVKADLAAHQTVVYDSHNVEGFLRAQLLDESNPIEAHLLRGIVRDELELCQRADLIFACSQDDLVRFNRLYRIPADRMRVVPNGVMAGENIPPTEEEKRETKRQLGIDRWPLVAFFIGSGYGPNVEAARFIVEELALAAEDVLFVVGGGVGAHCHSGRKNVVVTGTLSDGERKKWLWAADVAVNPMFSGSGTNIKMFDFMSVGLPTVTTDIGARGIFKQGKQAFLIAPPTVEGFMDRLRTLECPQKRVRLGIAARTCIVENFAWEVISPQAGGLLAARSRYAQQPVPMFSVIVAPEDSDTDMEQIIKWLALQYERDFEVIVVDRSRNSWAGIGRHYGFPLTYLHRPHLGIGEAMNAGAFLAMGHFLIISRFDELADERWLLRIRDALTGHGGNAGVVAWIPPSFTEYGCCFQSIVVRAEALRLVGGFDTENRIWDLARPDTIVSRLRRIGVVEKSSLFNGPSMRPGIEEKAVLLLTTQGHKCGVGEYTASLVDSFERKGFKCYVLTCQTETLGIPIDTSRRATYVGWYYDDLGHSKSRIYPETQQFIREVKPSLVVIQYHPAFFGVGELERFAITCLERNTPVVIDDHRFRPEDAPSLKRLVERGASVFLHGQGECHHASTLDLDTVLSPIGIDNLLPLEARSIVGRDWRKTPPRLVTTGFLRAHKGVRTLIKAMPRILDAFPGAVLRVQCAEYPSVDSAEEIVRCHTLIAELGLNSQVKLDTAFHEKSEVFALIRDADLALLAYDESEEGGSAAAGDCFSVGLPLMVSTAMIFDDIRPNAMTVKGGPEDWAEEVVRLLESPDAYARLASSARDFVFDNNWDKAVDRFIRLIH